MFLIPYDYVKSVAEEELMQVLAYGYHWRARWQLRHIPGPKPSFLMGNWEFVSPSHMEDIVLCVQQHNTLHILHGFLKSQSG